MKKWTKDSLEAAGYKIENARIVDVDLYMNDYDWFVPRLTISGNMWGTAYGGYAIGSKPAGKYEGYSNGVESIMRIMDVIGEREFSKLKGKYVRVAIKGTGLGEIVKIIGNIIEDMWFDYGSFFDDCEKEQECDNNDY